MKYAGRWSMRANGSIALAGSSKCSDTTPQGQLYTLMKPDALKAAVLISGTGSNLKTLIDAVAADGLNLNIVRVVSNRADAPGLNHASAAAIPVSVISHADFPDRQAHDAAVAEVLQQSQAELIILAGYMRILGEEFTSHYAGRMINLHPSLLPLYKGLDTYNRVLAAQVTAKPAPASILLLPVLIQARSSRR